MKNIRFFALIYLTLFTTASLAAEPESSNTISNQAAAFLATNAKYHVVIGVLVVILLGLVVYGLILNKKLSNLEANQK
jgi:hypothetical protein